jgi:hypothetical protein
MQQWALRTEAGELIDTAYTIATPAKDCTIVFADGRRWLVLRLCITAFQRDSDPCYPAGCLTVREIEL